MLYEGAKEVKLFGETIAVRAEIGVLPGVSGHADRDGLLAWLRGFEAAPPRQVFVNHGDGGVCDAFAAAIKAALGYEAMAPYSGTAYDLAAGEFVKLTEGVPVVREGEARRNKFFAALVKAAERLLAAAKSAEGRPNRELRRWTERIEAIIKDMSE